MSAFDVGALSVYVSGFAAASGFGLAVAGRIIKSVAGPLRDFVSSNARNELHSARTVALLEQVLATQQQMDRRLQVFEAVHAAANTVPVPSPLTAA